MTTSVNPPTAPAHKAYVYAEKRRNLDVGYASMGDEWQVLPQSLHESLDGADQIVILDPLSFPFEDLREQDWWIPIVVAWPDSVPVTVALELLDGPLLSHLTFFDSIVVDDDSIWEELRRSYRFAESQRIPLRGRRVQEWVAATIDSGLVARRAANEVAARGWNPSHPWSIRCHEAKRFHLTELDALVPALHDAERVQPAGKNPRIAHVGVGIGRFASVLAGHEYTGFSRGPAATAQAQSNFPNLQIRQLGSHQSLALEQERWDIAIVTHEMSTLTSDARHSLISSMWSALRVGGRLIVLDSFVPHRSRRSIEADHLIADLLTATNYQLVVSDVTSIRSPGSPTRNLGLLTMTKIGVPNKW